jgi:hypothetical protein
MQHNEHGGAEPPIDHSAVLRALWPCLSTDDRRTLRLCCATMREAVDAQASCVEEQAVVVPLKPSVLCPATCARLDGVHTLTLCSTLCLRRMLLVAPAQPGGAVFPRLQSLRLHLVRAEANAQLHAPCSMRA